MKNVQTISLGLALLVAPAVHAISLPTISLPSLPTIGMPQTKYGQAAAVAGLIAAGYGIYKSGIIGKSATCIVDQVIRHPKKALALLAAVVAATVAYKCGYISNIKNITEKTTKTGTVDPEIVVDDLVDPNQGK
ncbi:MAG TPA: hypothetical protein VGW78_07225 [Candidatus Babeliales bacterium]|jgi:hypothetical protein|nr:hypothetical protein [Candidatus Babeliales bacterium]